MSLRNKKFNFTLLAVVLRVLVFYFCVSVDMAGTSTRQYNLRSCNQETIQFPVQLQMEDGIFLNKLLKQQNGQVSDSESSISESVCEALIASDPESYAKHLKSSSCKDKVASSSKSGSITQDVINAKILAQLDKLGKTLDSIESNASKQSVIKTKCKQAKRKVDSLVTVSPRNQVQKIPDLNVLQMQDMSVKALVDQHLRQLADAERTGTKIKSLRGVFVEVLVPNRVTWPHEYVLSGSSKECVSYDQLSTTQWVAGFCRIMKEEKNSNIRDHMLDYMILMMPTIFPGMHATIFSTQNHKKTKFETHEIHAMQLLQCWNITVKHMRPGVYCINICVQPAFSWQVCWSPRV